jgi:hypothetical protein
MCQRLSFGVRWSIGRVHLPCPLACWIVGQALARKSGRSRDLTAGGYMSDPREGKEFFLNVPEKLDNPYPDLKYFREQRPVFYYPPLQTWFIFRYDDVSTLFHDARLSADRMKGFVDAAPTDVRDGLRTLAPSFERWVLMKDGQDHARLRQFLNLRCAQGDTGEGFEMASNPRCGTRGGRCIDCSCLSQHRQHPGRQVCCWTGKPSLAALPVPWP